MQCESSSVANRFDFLLNLAKSASGVEAYLILKSVFWDAMKVNYCSWHDIKNVLQNRSELNICLASLHSYAICRVLFPLLLDL